MDVITVYLYGSLDWVAIWKFLTDIQCPSWTACASCIQSSYRGRFMDYGNLVLCDTTDYVNTWRIKVTRTTIYARACLSRVQTKFHIVTVYVHEINLIGTPNELTITDEHLKKEFNVKELGKTKLRIELEHMKNVIVIHQSIYTERLLKHFNMDNVWPWSVILISTIGNLMYLTIH